MPDTDLRKKLKGEVQSTHAPELLPHHRRDALLIVRPSVDFLEAAMAIAADDAELVGKMLADDALYKPSLAELSDWCVDQELRFQFVILQPYVLAQAIVAQSTTSDPTKN